MDVFSGLRRDDRDSVVHKDTLDRRFRLGGHDDHFITFPDPTSFDLTHRHTSSIMVPVEQRYPQGGVRISPFDLQLVEHLQQRLLGGYGVAFFGARIPPATSFAVDLLEDVGSGKSGNGNEPDLLLDDVAAGLQERFQFRNAFVEALALPLDLRA